MGAVASQQSAIRESRYSGPLHLFFEGFMVAYLFDKITKQRIASGNDINKIFMVKDVLVGTRPCFILVALIGGKWEGKL